MKFVTGAGTLHVRKGKLIADFQIMGMCFFCHEIELYSKQISKTVTWLWACLLLFLEMFYQLSLSGR